MNLDKIRSTLSDSKIAALTVFREAANQGACGQIAVASVIRNRADQHMDQYGKTVKEVCLKPLQFSCWNDDKTENHTALMQDATQLMDSGIMSINLEQALYIVEGVLSFKLLDNTRGSTHYMTKALFDSNPPSWAKGMKPRAEIGAHVFFKL